MTPALESDRRVYLALSRHPADRSWWFALQGDGQLAHGPLQSDWHGLPQLRDLADRLPGTISEAVIAIPTELEEDDVISALRRVPGLGGARVRVHQVAAANSSTEASGAGTSIADVRQVIATRFDGLSVEAIEDGAVLAIAMLVAGEAARERWRRRFGSFNRPVAASAEEELTPVTTLANAPGPARRRSSAHQVNPRRRSHQELRERSTPFVTLVELAAILGIDRTTAYRMAQRGDFPTHRVGRGIRIRRQDIEEFLTQQRVPSYKEVALTRRGKITALPRMNIEDDEQRGRDLADKLGL